MVDCIQEKKRGIDVLTVLAFLIVARFSCAALSNIPVFTMAFTFIYGAAFVALFFATLRRRILLRELILFMGAFLYTVFVVCQNILAGKGLFFTDAFNSYTLIFLLTVYLWAKHQPKAVRRALLLTIFAGILFSQIYSIIVLLQDSSASRVVASAQRSPKDIINAVGGFEEVYGGVYLVCILLFAGRAMKGSKNRRKFIAVGLLCLSIVFIVLASYATALLLLLLGIALFLASNNKYITVLLIVAAIVALIFHEPIGQWLMDVSEQITFSEMLSERVYNIGEMFQTFEAAGTYGGEDGRLSRMDRSWQTFLQYPILGGFSQPGARYGGHSEFFDILAKYGLVGMSLLIVFFINVYRDVRSNLPGVYLKKCCSIIFLLYLMTAVVNPALFAGQLLPLILILPLIPALIAEKETVAIEEKRGELPE